MTERPQWSNVEDWDVTVSTEPGFPLTHDWSPVWTHIWRYDGVESTYTTTHEGYRCRRCGVRRSETMLWNLRDEICPGGPEGEGASP